MNSFLKTILIITPLSLAGCMDPYYDSGTTYYPSNQGSTIYHMPVNGGNYNVPTGNPSGGGTIYHVPVNPTPAPPANVYRAPANVNPPANSGTNYEPSDSNNNGNTSTVRTSTPLNSNSGTVYQVK